jgi:large subunit ribosomal protein L23
MNIYEVIKRPVITEGSTQLAAGLNQYTFEVDQRANKIEIKQAVEQIFNVDVLKVATMIMPKKMGTRGRKRFVRSPQWKKAIVTLPDGQKIADFNV